MDASLTTCLFTIFTLQLYNSDIDVNIDEEELALYLAVTVDRKKLEDLDLGDVVHTRIKSGGRNPGITTKEILKRSEKEKTPSLFHLPVRKPTTDESRKMLSLSIEIAIKAAMSEHMYSFNGQIRKQETGGAIGNVLTGALAVLYMLYWTKTFLKRLDEATKNILDFTLYLMKIYVDDCNLAMEALPLGSRLVDGEVKIIEEEIDKDKDIPDDIRTSNIIVDIANSICHFIKLTVDSPSRNETGWMPLLDLKVQVQQNQIFYEFYKKKVSNPLLMLNQSAMPSKVKRASLTQEALRRLRNTKREIP